jgi:hypothetical protein
MEHPPAMPTYKPWKDPVEKSVAFEQLDSMFEQRIVMIDGAMGTNIQDYKLDENDYRGERYKVCFLLLAWGCTVYEVMFTQRLN